MTVKDLKELCEKEINKGNADKVIYVADDEEGNGFHQLPYGFTHDKEILEDIIENYSYDADFELDEIICLG